MEDPAAQQRALTEANKRVMQEAFHMKRATDSSDTKNAFTHAANMLKELKTTQLSPRNYYELYMKVLDELRHLEDFFTTQNKQARQPMVGLYEQAQACTMVLPRLYLLNTVGACYILSKEAPARDILKDLLEMTKGVQHPMRGLFLRNYFSHVTRDKLPDAGSPYEGDGGTVDDSVEFVLENFVEANKLWVRMHGQGPSKDKKRRERERKDLRLLVGTNLVRLSQLEGVDGPKYKTDILPAILEQIVGCKDTIAQSYLMDCLIQVFPDEFHLASLEPFLDGVCRLKEKVRVRPVLESLMERIGNYVEEHPNALPRNIDAFRLMNDCVTRLVSERPKLELSEIMLMLVSLLQFASQCYPGKVEYVNHCIGVTGRALVSRGFEPLSRNRSKGGKELPFECVEALLRLLSIPLRSMGLGVLSLTEYVDLMYFLPWESQKRVSLELLRSVLSKESALTDLDCVDKLLAMIAPILRDPSGGEKGEETTDATMQAALEEERRLVARVVHLMRNDDTDRYFRMLVVARRHLGQGSPSQVQYTLVPLVFRALGLARTIRAAEIEEDERASAAAEAAAAAAEAAAAAAEAAAAAAEAVAAAAQAAAEAEASESTSEATKGEKENASLEGIEGEGRVNGKEDGEGVAKGSMTNGDNEATSSSALVVKEGGATEATEAAGSGGQGAALVVVPPPPSVRPRQFSSRKAYQFLHEIVTAMAPLHPWTSLTLFLQCALGADHTGFKAIAYEFFSQAFILYEDELTDSKAQVRALVSMVGTLLACNGFDPTDYDALATKTAQYAAKLLKKPDQCRMVTLCSHLFWSPEDIPGRRDPRRVLECLQRSLKIADVCITGGVNAQLFIEILNHYLYFFEANNPEIAGRYITGLVALINEHIESLEPSDARSEMERHFANTVDHIQRKKVQEDISEKIREKFASVQI